MSRIGKLPIQIPSGVTVSVENNEVKVSGAKGNLSQQILPGIEVDVKDNTIFVARQNEEIETRSKHGLMRSLINNMVEGVAKGFSKQLEINGVGYRVSLAGQNLKFNIGLSHDVLFPIPTGVSATVEQNIITVSGFDKQLVGQVAADIRKLKKPEPYKGKGIKYVGERILRKSGKSGKE